MIHNVDTQNIDGQNVDRHNVENTKCRTDKMSSDNMPTRQFDDGQNVEKYIDIFVDIYSVITPLYSVQSPHTRTFTQ